MSGVLSDQSRQCNGLNYWELHLYVFEFLPFQLDFLESNWKLEIPIDSIQIGLRCWSLQVTHLDFFKLLFKLI